MRQKNSRPTPGAWERGGATTTTKTSVTDVTTPAATMVSISDADRVVNRLAKTGENLSYDLLALANTLRGEPAELPALWAGVYAADAAWLAMECAEALALG
ncbi:MAG TPA: hypothetical protein VKQ36_14470, partial [Ktedonobacterales bacterium]|nr:hypothetical protein [Ktedonobacterales bacterium]